MDVHPFGKVHVPGVLGVWVQVAGNQATISRNIRKLREDGVRQPGFVGESNQVCIGQRLIGHGVSHPQRGLIQRLEDAQRLLCKGFGKVAVLASLRLNGKLVLGQQDVSHGTPHQCQRQAQYQGNTQGSGPQLWVLNQQQRSAGQAGRLRLGRCQVWPSSSVMRLLRCVISSLRSHSVCLNSMAVLTVNTMSAFLKGLSINRYKDASLITRRTPAKSA